MKYSYEYKLMCVDLYRQGKWPDTPEGVTERRFRDMVRIWVRQEDARGPDILQHKNHNKAWTAEEKYEYVAQVLAGKSFKEVAISAGIECSLLYQWVRRYKMKGYEGLVAQRKGRPPKESDMNKKVVPAELTPSEREEMIRLRAENERLQAEIAVIKKEIALREERCAAQLKAKKRRSSKNSVEKDMH
ncbi:MAG: transposase [Oscillospiraceae bacterium]|nr:transposase [Oscillospiraceae bacterium]